MSRLIRSIIVIVLALIFLLGSLSVTNAQNGERSGVAVTVDQVEGLSQEPEAFMAAIPADWISTEQPRYDIHMVPEVVNLDTCSFDPGGTIISKRIDITVTVTDLETAEMMGSQYFMGSWPPSCMDANSVPPAGITMSLFSSNLFFSASDEHFYGGFDRWLIQIMAGTGLPGTPTQLIEWQARVSGSSGAVEILHFSPDGQTIIVGGERGVDVLNPVTGEILSQIYLEGTLRQATYSPDGLFILTPGNESVAIWDVSTGEQVFQLDGHYAATYSPDGNHIAYRSGEIVHVLEVSSRQEVLQLVGNTRPYMQSISYSPDGQRIVTLANDDSSTSELIVWDAMSGEEILRFTGPTRYFSAHYGPDGTSILGFGPGAVNLLDSATGEAIWELSSFNDVACFSPDGRFVATGDEDGGVHIWDAASGQELRQLIGHTGYVRGIDFSPDGRSLASVDFLGIVLFWDISDLGIGS